MSLEYKWILSKQPNIDFYDVLLSEPMLAILLYIQVYINRSITELWFSGQIVIIRYFRILLSLIFIEC